MNTFDWVFVIVTHLLGGIAAIHALLNKRDPRAAMGWLIVCLVIPVFGVIAYLLFGLNHISMVAKQWESRGMWKTPDKDPELEISHYQTFADAVFEQHAFQALVKSGDKVGTVPLVAGCLVEPLYDGTEAYPVMLEAIHQAKNSVYMSTYIFGTLGWGGKFIEALAAAHRRGVNVKVLVDGIGGLYSWPTATKKLRKLGVPAAAFLPPFSTYHTLHLNLRNHRKILVVDGAVGFAGGMNIHDDNVAQNGNNAKIHDIHFRIQGPAVGYLQDVVLRDWYFATKENISKVVYYDNTVKGDALCRAYAPGPHHKYSQLQLMLSAAFSCAQKRIRIMSPYFLLGYALTASAVSAALRGVKIEVILPESNNLSFVKGASEAGLPLLIEHGIDIYYKPGAFDHSKLFIVDDFCVFLGSSNLDVRSLMLNFEFNLEVHDRKLAAQLIERFDGIKQTSRLITLDWLQSRGFLVKFYNSIFKLFSLYM